jgi:type VI protein secretion system component VasK
MDLALRGEQDESWSPGARPMQKDVWHVIWLLMLMVAVLLLGLTLVIALYHHDSSTFANVASIWGLFVGLIDFIVTIYTLFETQRVARKAQHEIQAATLEAQQKIQEAAKQAQEGVKNAQAQTRQLLERVRHGVREADFSTLRMWVRELQSAASSESTFAPPG